MISGKRYRSIETNRLAEPFVREILGFSEDADVQKAIVKIIEAEDGIGKADLYPTITHSDCRDIPYVSAEDRAALRERIFSELVSQKRPDCDDTICLGEGGALPLSQIQAERQFFFLIGLPASGKSFLANRLCEQAGSLLLDSDYAKRKLPEYRTRKNGASLVHKESQRIIMGDPENSAASSVYQYGVANNYNMVYPCIGNKLDEVVGLAESLRGFGYASHLILVDLDRLKATRRAYTRYVDTERYIPLSKIYDDYANDPLITYFRARQLYRRRFKSFGQVDTDVDMKLRFRIVEKTTYSPLVEYIPEEAPAKGGVL